MTNSPHHRAGRAIAKGAGLMIGLRLADRIISVASFSILARLLRPDDYGVFALALSVVAIIGTAGNWGFDSALIQHRGLDRRRYDTAWTLRLLAGAVVAGLLCIAAMPTARIFAEPRIEPALYWLALGSFIADLENIGTVDFLKALDYRRELVYRLAIRMMLATMTVLLAYAWPSYWALVAGNVVGNAAMVALSYRVHPYRPRWSLSRFDSLLRFTRWVFLRNIFQAMNDNIANVTLGRLVGVAALSYFTFARELSTVVTTDLYAPVRRALFPAYASVNDDIAALKRLTVESTALMILIGLPLSAGLAVVAPDVVRVLLGDRWLAVIPLLQTLAIAACIGSGISGAPVLFVAIGRPDTAAKLAGFRLVVLASLLVIGASMAGTIGAAWAMVATAGITLVVNWRLVGQHLALSHREMRHAFSRPFIASGFMALAVLSLRDALPDGQSFGSSLLRLCACITAGALAYVLSLLILWRIARKPGGAEQQVLDLLAIVGKRLVPWRGRVSGGGS